MKFTAVLFVLLSTVLIADCLQCRSNSKRNGKITNKRCKKARGIETSPSCGCRIYNDLQSGTSNLKYTYYCLRDSKWCDENTNGLNKCAFYNGTNFEELRCCCDTTTDCCENFIAEAKNPKETTTQTPVKAKIASNTEGNEEASGKTAKLSAESEKASDEKEEVSEKSEEVSEETEEVSEESEEVSEETEEVSESEEESSDTETDDSNVSSTTQSSDKSQSYTTTASLSQSNDATTTLSNEQTTTVASSQSETTTAATSQSETTTAATSQSESVKTISDQSASATTQSTSNDGTDGNSVDENVVAEEPIETSDITGSPNSVDDLNSVRRDEPVHRQQQKSASVAQLSLLLPAVLFLTIFL